MHLKQHLDLPLPIMGNYLSGKMGHYLQEKMDNYSFEKYWKHFAQMVKFLILDQSVRSFMIFIRTWLLIVGVHRSSESLTYQSDVGIQSDERFLNIVADSDS